MKKMQRLAALLLALALLVGCAPGMAAEEKSGESYVFTDSVGREVTIPKNIGRLAPSGSYAQMMVYAIAPEKLMGLSGELSEKQKPYMLEEIWDLPVFGQFYGKNATTNYEAIIKAAPDVIIDMGDVKKTVVEDMDKIQEQTGIPTIFIEANLKTMAQAFETLGKLLGEEETGHKLAAYTQQVMDMAAANAAKIPEDRRKKVLFAMGDTGLEVVGRSSIHSEVIQVVGAVNAAEQDALSSGGNDTVSMEQILNWQPDVILLSPGSIYDTIAADPLWAEVQAVKDGRVCEIPGEPYNWLSRPPAAQRLLGIVWLGNLLYPAQYDYDIVAKTREFYSLFFRYELSADQAKELLSRSTLQSRGN